MERAQLALVSAAVVAGGLYVLWLGGRRTDAHAQSLRFSAHMLGAAVFVMAGIAVLALSLID